MNDHEYWEREREEGPTDWGPQPGSGALYEPSGAEWAEIQAEMDRQAPSPSPDGGTDQKLSSATPFLDCWPPRSLT